MTAQIAVHGGFFATALDRLFGLYPFLYKRPAYVSPVSLKSKQD